jgi:hypothetical protein
MAEFINLKYGLAVLWPLLKQIDQRRLAFLVSEADAQTG